MRKAKIEKGTDNIFADLGRPDAETHFLKAQIASESTGSPMSGS